MKKKILFLLIFALVFAGLFIFDIFVDDSASLDEKKALAQFPDKLSDEYLSEISDYFEDRSPLRNTLIKIKTETDTKLLLFYAKNIAPAIDSLFNYETAKKTDDEKQLEELKKRYGDDDGETHELTAVYTREASVLHDGITVYECKICGKRFLGDVVLRTSLEEFKNARVNYSANNGGVFGKFDWLFTTIDDSIAYYEGSNVLDEAAMASRTERFELLNDICNKKGIKLVLFIGPNKEQVYSEYMPDNLAVQTEEKRLDVLADYVLSNSDVSFVYPKEELKTAKTLYETYLMQDTHWNNVGGFVGAMAVYKALGMETSDLIDQDIITETRNGGDLSNFTGVYTEFENYIVNYRPEVSVKTENYFNAISNAVSSEKSIYYSEDPLCDGKLVLIGDSYRTQIESIVKKDFAKTTVVHNSDIYTADPQLGYSVAIASLQELGEGDVLVIEDVERRDADMVKVVDAVIELLSY